MYVHRKALDLWLVDLLKQNKKEKLKVTEYISHYYVLHLNVNFGYNSIWL